MLRQNQVAKKKCLWLDGFWCSIPFQIAQTAIKRVAVDVPYTSAVVWVRQEMLCHEPFDTIPLPTYFVVWLMSAVQQMHQNATPAPDVALVADIVAFGKLYPRLRDPFDQKTCGDADCADYVMDMWHHCVFLNQHGCQQYWSHISCHRRISNLFPEKFS